MKEKYSDTKVDQNGLRHRYQNGINGKVMNGVNGLNGIQKNLPYSPIPKKGKTFKPLPNYIGLLVPLTLLLLLRVSIIINEHLPEQVKIADEPQQPERFIGERAENYLKGLVDIGGRVVGSYENEVEAVEYMTKQIKEIISQGSDVHDYNFDIQRPTGNYYLDYKPFGLRNLYANIQNIVVRVSSRINATDSVLLNCHYDTVEYSPGASDDGLNCAVMLEVLRKISQSNEPLKNNVIFLFNGAEENPLQASHGFITQHKWSNEVRVLINVESCGAGTREFLFQTSPNFPWLIQAYADSIIHPSASVTFEEVFHTNLIPSDSDFRIFRDYGSVPGFDFAHCDNGYIYHTRYDNMDYIKPGVYQHTGDNILALVKQLAFSPRLSEIAESQKTKSEEIVYFDVFGKWLVTYTESFATVWNILCSLASVTTIVTTHKLYSGSSKLSVASLKKAVLIQLAGWVISGFLLISIANIVDTLNSTMSWYGHHIYVYILYWLPLFVGCSLLPVYFHWKNKETRDQFEETAQHIQANQLLLSCLLLTGTYFHIRSMYLTMLYVVFPTFSNIFLTLRKNVTAKQAITANLFALLFPVLFTTYISVRFLTVFIPMTGRSGPHINPEILVAIICLYIGIHAIGYMCPLLLLCKSPPKIIAMISAIIIGSIVVISSTPLGFPYRGDLGKPAFQRFYLLHTERTFYNQLGDVRRHDSGFWLLNMDRNSRQYLSQEIPEVNNAFEMLQDCDLELYCGVPVFKSRMVSYMEYSNWMPTAVQPVIHNPTVMEVVNQTELGNNMRRIQLKITGSDHMSVLLCPVNGVAMKKWSFDDKPPNEERKWNGRSTYFVYYSHGLMGGTVEFSVDLHVGKNIKGPIMDMAVIGHYLHDETFWTPEFAALIRKFPEWSHVAAWSATYKSWVI